MRTNAIIPSSRNLLVVVIGCMIYGHPSFRLKKRAAISYEYGSEGSDDTWLGLCKTGKAQSPIDLSPSTSAVGYLGKLNFSLYHRQYPVTVENTGHTLKILFGNKTNISISEGGLPGRFRLQEIHFHWKSEHSIRGRRYALETHFVHVNKKYGSTEVALKNKDGIAVLGVLHHVSEKGHSYLDKVLEEVDNVKDEPKVKKESINNISPKNLFPSNADGFYRYEGSLTTPTCDESVIWTVFTESLPISSAQFEQFRSLKVIPGEMENYRQTKPIVGRLVTYQESSGTDKSLGVRNKNFFSIFSLFITIFIVVFNK